jgi:hypothetical protein
MAGPAGMMATENCFAGGARQLPTFLIRSGSYGWIA